MIEYFGAGRSLSRDEAAGLAALVDELLALESETAGALEAQR